VTKRLFAVSVLALAMSIPSIAQTGAQAKDPALQAAIEAREKSINARNGAEWSKYTSDDFIVVTAEGPISGKAERLKRLMEATGGSQATHVIENIRTFGTDTAVTIERGEATRITYFRIRQSGTWKVVSAQSTLIVKK
jgi:hypothetical protein